MRLVCTASVAPESTAEYFCQGIREALAAAVMENTKAREGSSTAEASYALKWPALIATTLVKRVASTLPSFVNTRNMYRHAMLDAGPS